jgi:Cyclic nucleotide-binding domain/Major Facilitator Superfamily
VTEANRSALTRTARTVAAVMSNHDLRRLEAAFALFTAAELGSWVAILIYAYRQGGATEAGIAAAVQLAPAALAAPILGAYVDRLGGVRGLVSGYALQCLTMTGTAVALATHVPPWAVYTVAATAACAVTATRPAHALVMPALAHSPLELGAANVLSGWITAMMALAAPALVGILLTVASPSVAFAAAAIATGVAALLAAALPDSGGTRLADDTLWAGARSVAAGARVVVANRPVRLLLGLVAALSVLVGAVDVLAVTLALGVLHRGAAGAGYLTAGFGGGGIAGAAVALTLIGRLRLAPHLLAAALVGGLSFVVLAIHLDFAIALLLFTTAGAAKIVFDVAAQTLLQRTAPTHVLSSVMASAEGLTMAGLALGSLVVPLLVALGGVRTALLGVGALLPLLVFVRLRTLLTLDSRATVPVVEISLLRSLPMFAILPPLELEGVARALTDLEIPAGTSVVVEGEEGDRFYAIASGTVEVVAAGHTLRRLGRGEGFGEIALLHDIPRTATVTAATDVRLYALERDDFLLALTRHASAQELAREMVAARLDHVGDVPVPS